MILVVTAVAAEAEAVRAGADPDRVVVEAVGVGPAAAAAGTARLLAIGQFSAVISAGIAGGFVGRAPVGAVVVGARSIAADLGAETPDGFLTVDELGFGTSVLDGDPALVKSLTAALPDAVLGDVVTLSTVTGTAATAERLSARYPQAVAEAMEGLRGGRRGGRASLCRAAQHLQPDRAAGPGGLAAQGGVRRVVHSLGGCVENLWITTPCGMRDSCRATR